MAVTIEIPHDEAQVMAVLMYEYSDKVERPNLSGAEIRALLVKHYQQVSRSAIDLMTERQIKSTEGWARRNVKGKGFHFKPRNTNWVR